MLRFSTFEPASIRSLPRSFLIHSPSSIVVVESCFPRSYSLSRCLEKGNASSFIYVLFRFLVLCDEYSVGFSGSIIVFFFISTCILFFESLFVHLIVLVKCMNPNWVMLRVWLPFCFKSRDCLSSSWKRHACELPFWSYFASRLVCVCIHMTRSSSCHSSVDSCSFWWLGVLVTHLFIVDALLFCFDFKEFVAN